MIPNFRTTPQTITISLKSHAHHKLMQKDDIVDIMRAAQETKKW